MEKMNELALIVETVDRHKGENINVLDISEVSGFADYFVIVTSANKLHSQALARYVEESMKKEAHHSPLHIEGMKEGEWILIDFGDIIVQIFNNDMREYYGLDKLWGDAQKVDISGWIATA